MLAGCFSNPLEGLIEGVTGGNVDLGGSSLPSGFPSSEVPLIEGEIVYGGSVTAEGATIFNVTIKVQDASALETITSQLEGAGFTSSAGTGAEGVTGGGAVFTSDKWGVLVVVSEDGTNGFVANYTVTSAATQ
jgi:hypothetical protein